MLVLTDSQTGKPFFSAVGVEFAPPWQTSSFRMGDRECEDCFSNSMPLFDPRNGILLGNLSIDASPVFYRAMRDDTRNSFLIWTASLLALMSLGWWALSLYQAHSTESDSRATAIFDASPIPLLLVRQTDGSIVDANEAAEQLLSSTLQSAVRIDGLLEPEAFAVLAEHRSIGSRSIETRLQLPEGRLPVIATATPVDIAEAAWLIIALIDVSDHKAFEKRIEEEREKSETASRAKSAFLAAMSHEIRTPLNGILGFTHVLSQSRLDDEQREHLELIDISARNLLGIIEEILDFSRIEAGKFSVREACVDLHRLLDDTVRLFRNKAEEKGLELLYREEPGLPVLIETDGLRLRQLIGILLDNAIKFTPRGGLELETETRTEAPEPSLTLRVSDTGIGIPSDELPKLFEPFYQVDQSSRRPFGGTGLGLVIARNICESLGGSIEIDSREGHGSCFTVILPLRIREDARANGLRLESVPPRTAGIDTRALVVDDDPINGKLLVYLLQARNVIADRVETGSRAIQRIGERPYDLVFLDLHMPGLSGWDVVLELKRQQGQGTRTYPPLIATTADVQQGSRERLLGEGLDDFLAKPVDASALDAIIARWTSGKTDRG
jgi:signal transduction histidine kinase/ActR/RegA family two-component response regulator